MSKIGLIQSLFKGVSVYLPKDKSNSVLKKLVKEISKHKDLIEHYFIFFENRFECRYRIFVKSGFTSEMIVNEFSKLMEPYVIKKQFFDSPKQLFKGFEPYSIIPIAFIEHSDEIYVFKKNIVPTCNFLENLSNLIAQKAEEIDFEDANQKLEFTLELLLSSIIICEVSIKKLQQLYKLSLKNNSETYKEYLENQYAHIIEQNKENILHFRKSLLQRENKDNLFNVFWRKNDLYDYKLIIELIFKVLNTSYPHQSYCLYILQQNAQKID